MSIFGQDSDMGIPARAPKSESKLTQGTGGPVFRIACRWSVEHNETHQKKLSDLFKRIAKKWIFQAEDTKDNPHYQCYIDLHKKDRPKSLAISLNDEFIGIDMQHASEAGISALKNYCMKDESRVAGPWADCKIYMGADLPKVWRPWQNKFLELCQEDPSDRKITWIYDPVGENGKSKVTKFLEWKKQALGLAYSSTKDLLCEIVNEPPMGIYIFDLTCTKPKDAAEADLYAAFEQLKNGNVRSSKYVPKRLLMDPPHVFVMSNTLPRTELMMKNRWTVYEIEKNNLVLRK